MCCRSSMRLLLHCVCLVLMACDDDLVAEDRLQLWCDDDLCDWILDRGDVDFAPTWHAYDRAARLLDASEGTQLSRVVETDDDCFRIGVLADVVAEAEVLLVLDFDDDGSEDLVREVATAGWQALEYPIHRRRPYQDLRVIVRKSGRGRAVVAHVDLKSGGCEK